LASIEGECEKMTTITVSESLKSIAKDLSKDFPRSPREKIGGYVIVARMLDKCRAELNGTHGEYHFNCPLDNIFLSFSGIEAEAFKAFVATGATDEQVGAYINEHATPRPRIEIIQWNNSLLDKNISEMAPELQEYFEDYIPQNIPAGRVIYRWFDIYDIEEKRI
jgi:hypothetical protein